MKRLLTLAGLAAIAFATPAAAQQFTPRLFSEIRGGGVVPTFDIADVATAGPSFGATVGYHLTPRWVLLRGRKFREARCRL